MKKSTLNTVFTTFLLILVAAACSNSTSGEEEEDHPEGFRLMMNNQTIVEQLPHQDLTGEFFLETGEVTDLITIQFLDHDGNQFQPEDDLSLGYEIEDENVVVLEQDDNDGKWSFHLHAHTEGSTTMNLLLMHGTHSDFTTGDIPINVEAVE